MGSGGRDGMSAGESGGGAVMDENFAVISKGGISNKNSLLRCCATEAAIKVERMNDLNIFECF